VKDIRVVKTECFAKGGEHCEWTVNWR
jgi:predicted hydrocarbon binding protein